MNIREERKNDHDEKLFSVLMTLCLLCTAASALAEETPTWGKMPQVVTVDEDGNLVLSLFVPAEGDTPVCVTYFMVHPET